EPDDPDALVREELQPAGDERAGRVRGEVKVDLLRPVSRPERCPNPLHVARLLDPDRREGRIRLAEKYLRDVAVGWNTVRPYLVERDEEIGVPRSPSEALEVPELSAL